MFDETTQANRKIRSDVPIKAFSFCELRKGPPADSVPEPPQKGAIIIQITMPKNTPHWNLTETAAWIVFRNLSVVERFSDPAPENWQAYMMYESMWLCPKVAEPSELGDALRSGRLSALGRSGDPGSKMMTIPAIDWETLIVSPPSAYRLLPDNTKDVPWHDIRASSADVQKLWRGTSETTSRAKFDWVSIRSIHEGLRLLVPEFSKNELIKETQQAFQDKFNKEPPSRSSLQRQIARWI